MWRETVVTDVGIKYPPPVVAALKYESGLWG
jgi:hypothetical protein